MKRFNKKKVIISVIALVLLMCYVYSFPRNYKKSVKAIYYKLGDVEGKETRTIDISFDGKYKNRIFFGDRFKGKIIIDEKQLDVVELDMKNSFDLPLYCVFYKITGQGDFLRYDNYGWIHTNGNLKKFVIAIYGEEKNGVREWRCEDGYVIATPCINRQEALILTKRLMGRGIKLGDEIK